jgi:glycosyltransferase involved in cell wall biosynthesis
MRICFVMPPFEFYSPVSGGAIATVTLHVARELERQGHRVEVITPVDGQPTHPVGELHCIPQCHDGALQRVLKHLQARCMGWDSPEYRGYWQNVQRLLSSARPDVVVLANDIGSAQLVRQVHPRCVLVSWLHNECPLNRGTGKGLRQTDVFLACSEYIRQWFISESKLDSGAVFTAHAGVDSSLFFPAKPRGTGSLRLLYVGRLDPNKGVDAAVDAFRILRKRSLPFKLSVAGGGWFYRRNNRAEDGFVFTLRNKMDELGVDWLGHVPRRWLPGVIREHDIALVLSRSQEPFGLVVLEAMASGLVVLASPHGGLTEACGEAGIFVDPFNPGQVADRLEELANAPEQVEELKKKAVLRASEATWKNTADVLVKSIKRVRES